MVILMDTRGHGRSSQGFKVLSFSQFAKDAKALLDHLEITNVHVLGFSDGANTAMQMALYYPNLINTLLLNGGNLTPAGIKRSIQYPIVFGYGILCIFALFSRTCQQKKAVMALLVQHPNLKPNDLFTIQIPALIIVGDRDMVKRTHSQLIANSLPNAVFQELDGTHFIARDAHEQFFQHVHAFIQAKKR